MGATRSHGKNIAFPSLAGILLKLFELNSLLSLSAIRQVNDCPQEVVTRMPLLI